MPVPARVEIDAVLAGERFDLGVLPQILRRDVLNVVIDREDRLTPGRRSSFAPICLNFGITAPVLSCVIT